MHASQCKSRKQPPDFFFETYLPFRAQNEKARAVPLSSKLPVILLLPRKAQLLTCMCYYLQISFSQVFLSKKWSPLHICYVPPPPVPHAPEYSPSPALLSLHACITHQAYHTHRAEGWWEIIFYLLALKQESVRVIQPHKELPRSAVSLEGVTIDIYSAFLDNFLGFKLVPSWKGGTCFANSSLTPHTTVTQALLFQWIFCTFLQRNVSAPMVVGTRVFRVLFF